MIGMQVKQILQFPNGSLVFGTGFVRFTNCVFFFFETLPLLGYTGLEAVCYLPHQVFTLFASAVCPHLTSSVMIFKLAPIDELNNLAVFGISAPVVLMVC